MTTSVSRFNYQERVGEFQTKLRDYERRMNISSPVNLSFIEFHESACAQLLNKSICLPSWFLFKYEDIPERFRIRDMSDPRFNDSRFLNEVAGWMNEKIAELGLTTICRPADREILKNFIYILRDPSLFEKGKDFIIGHELAHLAHFQEGLAIKLYDSIALGGIMAAFFLLFLTVSMAPIVHLGITVGVCGIAIAMTVGGICGSLAHQRHAALSMIEEEKKADLDAVKMLNDAKGGIYYFQSSIDRHLALRRSSFAAQRDIDERGNNLKDKHHPPLTDRVAYLTQWQRETLRGLG